MKTPDKIISLVPSLTELLIELGLKDNIAGRTRFCVHPGEAVKDIPIVGGTKNPRLDKIKKLNPDLIIANKEENKKEHIEILRKDFSVEVTDISTIEDALICIHQIGLTADRQEKAEKLISDIQKTMQEIPEEPELSTAYFIWKDPWMTVGYDTYIHDVLSHWNLHNIFDDHSRYPKTDLRQAADKNPELILLSSEPYPFKEKHLPQVEQAFPDARVILVEGEWFSWYGSHMLHSFKRLNIWRKAIA